MYIIKQFYLRSIQVIYENAYSIYTHSKTAQISPTNREKSASTVTRQHHNLSTNNKMCISHMYNILDDVAKCSNIQ